MTLGVCSLKDLQICLPALCGEHHVEIIWIIYGLSRGLSCVKLWMMLRVADSEYAEMT